MQTERFNKVRKSILKDIFDKENIISVWRTIVRSQLREMEIKDLYDHYDFNYNIEERSETIRNEILNGSYKASKPLIYRIEKSFGVCRHLVCPQPSDCLVLQVLVENIASKILKRQPSLNAFYSRDKSTLSKPHEAIEYNLTWRQQWKQLQKRIYKFSEEKDLIIVTDLSNYYDNINITELKKVFTSFTSIPEVIIDLIFRIIEEISWVPDYLPYSGRGLPTINIEAIRLLAHSFLFEIDEVVMEKTDNCFTRWMDDIVIGVNNSKEGKEIISVISDMLKSRGLALNLSKTNFYNQSEFYFNFQIEQNLYIDATEKISPPDVNYNTVVKELSKKFKKHLKSPKAKYSDKITKRYITTFGKLKSRKLLSEVSMLYLNNPSVRKNLLIYLSNIGYSVKSFVVVLEIIKSIDVFDDISLFELCYLVTQWEIPNSDKSKKFIEEFEKHILNFSFKRKLPSDYHSVLWFKAKYNHPEELLKYIDTYKNNWNQDSFLKRQVTSALSRLVNFDKSKVSALLKSYISSGTIDTVTVATQIISFSKIKNLDIKLTSYLFPQSYPRYYPLPKFLVLCSVLNSEEIRNDSNVRKKIKDYIKDPFYLKWLEQQYNIA